MKIEIRARIKQGPRTRARINRVIYLSVIFVIVSGVAFNYLNLGTPKVAYAASQGPYSPGTFTTAARPGSLTSWTNALNTVSSDNIYATNVINLVNDADYSDYVQVSNFGFSIPVSVTITGIVVDVEHGDINSKTKDSQITLLKGGSRIAANKANLSAWQNSDGIYSYGSSSDLWGETWTPADINASNFGFSLSIERAGGGALNVNSRIDQIRITVYYTTPLPIELVYFNAAPEGHVVKCSWQTASEVNNDHFTVERSSDGKNFIAVGNIQGTGNSTSIKNYSFTDDDVAAGTYYYRLKQTDFDGKSTYSDIATVVIKKMIVGSSISIDNVFPNPFSESFALSFNSPSKQDVEIAVIDVSGKVLSHNIVSCEKGLNSYNYSNPGTMSNGYYYVKLSSEGKSTIQKIIKI